MNTFGRGGFPPFYSFLCFPLNRCPDPNSKRRGGSECDHRRRRPKTRDRPNERQIFAYSEISPGEDLAKGRVD